MSNTSAIDQDRLIAALARMGLGPKFKPTFLHWGGDLAAREVIAAAEESNPEDDPRTVYADAKDRVLDLFLDAFEREQERVRAELKDRDGVYVWSERAPEGGEYFWVEAGKKRVYATYDDEGFCFAIGWARLMPYDEALGHVGGWESLILGAEDGMGIVFDEADYWAGPDEGELSDTILKLIPRLLTDDQGSED